MMNRIFLLFLLSTIVIFTKAQPIDKKLQKALSELSAGFNGEIGFYVKNLRTGKIASLNADTIFPTASMVKIPILYGIMTKIDESSLQDTQQLVYKDSLYYAGIDILGSFKQDQQIELSKVMMLMLTMSDNTASLWLQSLAGTGTRINELLSEKGFMVTRVNSRTEGRQEDWKQYGWGQTSPREMATLLELIVNQQLINDSLDSRMLRLLGRNYFDQVAIAEIPSNIFVASKNGAVNASRSEVLYVNAGRDAYIFCVCTKNNSDLRWTGDNEAWQVTRKISRFLWNYYGE